MTNKWQQIKLGDVCIPQKGLTYKSEDYSSRNEGQIFITLKCIAKGGGFNTEGVKYIKKSQKSEKLHAGDLIIANTDLTRAGDVIGAPLFVPKLNGENEYLYSMDISKLEVDNSKLNQKYLYQYLLTTQVRNYMRGISSGSTVLHLKLKLVDNLSIPLPSMTVQQKIGNILSSIDEAIQKTDQIIQKSEELKSGLMNELLTKGIGHKKFNKTKLGEIPEEWELVALGDVAKITNGQVDPKKEPYSSMVLIAPNHIESNSGRILEKVTAFDQQAISGKYLVETGDVIYSKIRPYLKKVAIADLDCLCSADMYPIKGSDKLDARFLFHILLSDMFTNYANENSGRTGIPKINRDELNGYVFALPPINEQKRIASILSSVVADTFRNQELITKHLSLKNGLMHDIFNQEVQIN